MLHKIVIRAVILKCSNSGAVSSSKSIPGTHKDISLVYTGFLLVEQKRKITLIFFIASILFSFVTNTFFSSYLIDGEIFLL